MDNEIWKGVPNYEGMYQVSNSGRVRSLDRYVDTGIINSTKRFIKGIDLKFKSDKDGYHFIGLKKNQKAKYLRVHRLVALVFIDNPYNKPQVNHINGIKNDNRVENLEWCTLSENRQHAYDTGLQNGKSRQGVRNNFAKLDKGRVVKIRRLYSAGDFTQKEIANKFNVSQPCVNKIVNNKDWRHV